MSAAEIRDWLLDPRDRSLPPADMLSQLVERLMRAGVPLWRVNTSLRTLHPEVFIQNLNWERGAGCTVITRAHEVREQEMFQSSPVALIYGGSGVIRQRLDVASESLEFPVCRELKAKGGTDYVAMPLEFGDGRRTFVSFATDAQGGFTEAHTATLQAVLPALSLRVELASAYHATQSLLEVYLGHNAASRVLAGAFKRGTGERIDAAIWFCDMRGFTTLSDERSPAEVVVALDAYFDRVAGAIDEQGGEVLKFIGDAVLAIFAVDVCGSRANACERALHAGKLALDAMAALNAERATVNAPAMNIGVALHLGSVMYGNIGARSRLDFTVIGAAVNEVCRLESLCKPLGTPLVMSRDFAQACGNERVRSVGSHELKGVSRPVEVFALA